MPDFISVEEAAQYLGISGSAVRAAIKDGRLNATRVGGVHIIHKKDLEKYKVNPKMKGMGEMWAKKRKKKA